MNFSGIGPRELAYAAGGVVLLPVEIPLAEIAMATGAAIGTVILVHEAWTAYTRSYSHGPHAASMSSRDERAAPSPQAKESRASSASPDPEDPCAHLESARLEARASKQRVSQMHRNVAGLFVTAARSNEIHAQAFFRGEIPHITESLSRFDKRLAELTERETAAQARLKELEELCKE
jgi:hypothetical protein